MEILMEAASSVHLNSAQGEIAGRLVVVDV